MELTFQFESLADFFTMAGHGPYVWACYGIGFLCLCYLALSPLRSRKVFLEELRRAQRIEAHEKKQREQAASN
jgi:heme exporter protein D